MRTVPAPRGLIGRGLSAGALALMQDGLARWWRDLGYKREALDKWLEVPENRQRFDEARQQHPEHIAATDLWATIDKEAHDAVKSPPQEDTIRVLQRNYQQAVDATADSPIRGFGSEMLFGTLMSPTYGAMVGIPVAPVSFGAKALLATGATYHGRIAAGTAIRQAGRKAAIDMAAITPVAALGAALNYNRALDDGLSRSEASMLAYGMALEIPFAGAVRFGAGLGLDAITNKLMKPRLIGQDGKVVKVPFGLQAAQSRARRLAGKSFNLTQVDEVLEELGYKATPERRDRNFKMGEYGGLKLQPDADIRVQAALMYRIDEVDAPKDTGQQSLNMPETAVENDPEKVLGGERDPDDPPRDEEVNAANATEGPKPADTPEEQPTRSPEAERDMQVRQLLRGIDDGTVSRQDFEIEIINLYPEATADDIDDMWAVLDEGDAAVLADEAREAGLDPDDPALFRSPTKRLPIIDPDMRIATEEGLKRIQEHNEKISGQLNTMRQLTEALEPYLQGKIDATQAIVRLDKAGFHMGEEGLEDAVKAAQGERVLMEHQIRGLGMDPDDPKLFRTLDWGKDKRFLREVLPEAEAQLQKAQAEQAARQPKPTFEEALANPQTANLEQSAQPATPPQDRTAYNEQAEAARQQANADNASEAHQTPVGEQHLAPDAFGLPRVMRVIEASVIKIVASKYQYRLDHSGGKVNILEGSKSFNSSLSRPILAYERLNGEIELLDGHQRVHLAKETIERDGGDIDIQAEVMREADGITEEQAFVKATLMNLGVQDVRKQAPFEVLAFLEQVKDSPAAQKMIEQTAADMPNTRQWLLGRLMDSKLEPETKSRLLKGDNGDGKNPWRKQLNGQHVEATIEHTPQGLTKEEKATYERWALQNMMQERPRTLSDARGLARLLAAQFMSYKKSLRETSTSALFDESELDTPKLKAEREILATATSTIRADRSLALLIVKKGSQVEQQGLAKEVDKAAARATEEASVRLDEWLYKEATVYSGVRKMVQELVDQVVDGKLSPQAAGQQLARDIIQLSKENKLAEVAGHHEVIPPSATREEAPPAQEGENIFGEQQEAPPQAAEGEQAAPEDEGPKRDENTDDIFGGGTDSEIAAREGVQQPATVATPEGTTSTAGNTQATDLDKTAHSTASGRVVKNEDEVLNINGEPAEQVARTMEDAEADGAAAVDEATEQAADYRQRQEEAARQTRTSHQEARTEYDTRLREEKLGGRASEKTTLKAAEEIMKRSTKDMSELDWKIRALARLHLEQKKPDYFVARWKMHADKAYRTWEDEVVRTQKEDEKAAAKPAKKAVLKLTHGIISHLLERQPTDFAETVSNLRARLVRGKVGERLRKQIKASKGKVRMADLQEAIADVASSANYKAKNLATVQELVERVEKRMAKKLEEQKAKPTPKKPKAAEQEAPAATAGTKRSDPVNEQDPFLDLIEMLKQGKDGAYIEAALEINTEGGEAGSGGWEDLEELVMDELAIGVASGDYKNMGQLYDAAIKVIRDDLDAQPGKEQIDARLQAEADKDGGGPQVKIVRKCAKRKG